MLAITGAISVTSKETLYRELGFESVQHRCWFRTNCALSTRYTKVNHRVISTMYHPFKPAHASQGHLAVHPSSFHFKQNFFKKILFSLLELLNVTIWIYLYAIEKV